MKITQILALALIVWLLGACSTDNISDDPDPNPDPTISLPEDFMGLHNVFDGKGIGAGAWIGDDVVILFSKEGNDYCWIENGEVKDTRSMDDPASIFEDYILPSAGAAVRLRSRLYLINYGTRSYSNHVINLASPAGNWDNKSLFTISNFDYLLTQWGDDFSCPFEGVTAAYTYHPNRKCDNEDAWENLYMFDAARPLVTTYEGAVGNFRNTSQLRYHSLYDCSTNEKEGLNMNTIVEAAFNFPVNGKVYEVFTFNEGKFMVYSEIGSNETSDIYDIYE